jgi:hypothetical protein
MRGEKFILYETRAVDTLKRELQRHAPFYFDIKYKLIKNTKLKPFTAQKYDNG